MARPIASMSAVGFSCSKWIVVAEADDGVGQGGRRTSSWSARRALTFSSLTTRSNFFLISFWSSFMLSRLVEEPDDGDLVLGEVAEDLAGDLVERDADVAGGEGHVAADHAAAAEVAGPGTGGQHLQARERRRAT